MRSSLLSLALAVVLFAPVSMAQQAAQVRAAKAAAQPAAGDNDSQGGPQEGAADVAPDTSNAGQGNSAAGTSSSHTVERGDTLWDLSNKYLGSPWYWPKVWSYNPEIANPHWIYPGNQVRFVNSGEEVPTQVEVGDVPEAPVEAPITSMGAPLTYHPKSSLTLRTRGFVTTKELDATGKITGSFAQSERLTNFDQAYVTFKKQGDVRLGERYLIFHTGQEIEHPKTGDLMGYMTTLLGEAKVVKIHEKQKLVTVMITATWDEIQRGDLLGPAGEETLRNIGQARPNDKEATGYVVSGLMTWQTMVGEHELIVVDLGSDHGVQPGNTFTVIRQIEGLDEKAVLHPDHVDATLPIEDVGTCMAVEVKAKATTCLLTRSLREIVPGDRVQMRVSGSVAIR